MDLFVSYSRKYEKIQDCFGSIAEWIRIIYIIAKGIADYFSNKIFLLKVVNNIFIPSNNINNTQKTSFFNSNFKSEFENNEIREIIVILVIVKVQKIKLFQLVLVMKNYLIIMKVLKLIII